MTTCRRCSRTHAAMKALNRRVLAVDPGYDRLGLAVLEGDASSPVLVWSDCIVPKKAEAGERLREVSRAVTAAIASYAPAILAIEKLFFSANKKTALKVAEARGAILSAAAEESLPVVEYSPQQVKAAVTGYGGADKRAVARMLPHLLSLSDKKRLDDEIDAIAIGITALASGR